MVGELSTEFPSDALCRSVTGATFARSLFRKHPTHPYCRFRASATICKNLLDFA